MTHADPVTTQRRPLRWGQWLARMLLVLLVFAGLGVWCWQVGQYWLAQRIAKRIQSSLHGLDVHIDGARIVSPSCIELSGVRLVDRQAAGARATRLLARQVYLSMPNATEWLAADQSAPFEIVVVGGELQLEQFADRTWNFQHFLRTHTSPLSNCRLVARDVKLLVRSAQTATSHPVSFHDVQLQCEHRRISSGASGWRGTFQCGSTWCSQVQFQFDFNTAGMTLNGHVKGVRISPEVWDQLVAFGLAPAGSWRSLRGELDGTIQLRLDRTGWTWDVESRLTNGWFTDAEFPYAFTAIQAQFQWNNHGVRISNASARAGIAEVTLEMTRTGWEANAPGHLRLQAHRLPLDERLVRLLPEPLRRIWADYQPSGRADVELSIDTPPPGSSPRIVAQLSDLAFIYHKFPYRVSRARGQLTWNANQLSLHLQVPVNGRTTRVTGQLRFPQQGPLGWVDLVTEGAIPIDEELIGALPESTAQFVRSLNANGTLEIAGRWERTEPHMPWKRRIELFVQNGSLRYDRFPYPLERVQGHVLIEDRRVWFNRFTARNDSGYFTASGHWDPNAEDGWSFHMNCHATDVPLHESLRAALSPSAQKLWWMVQPQGTVDQLQVQIAYRPADRQLDVRLAAEKWPPEKNVEGRAISLRPVWFPYRWDNVVGRFTYEPGRLSFENVQAERGPARIRALNGVLQMQSDGSWQVKVSRADLERWTLDEELLGALPVRLTERLNRLGLHGTFHGTGELLFEGDTRGLASVHWKGYLDTEDGHLDYGRCEHIRGGASIQGSWLPQTWQMEGNFHVDSLQLRGIPISRIRGPFRWTDSKLILGDLVDGADPVRSRAPITARLFGGDLSFLSVVQLEQRPSFVLQAELAGAELDEALAQLDPTGAALLSRASGKLSGRLVLRGTAGVPETLSGQGTGTLREANLYELPLMIALLKLLNVRPPDPTAFTSGDVQFRLEAERLYFSRIALQGDAISLIGRGDAGLSGQLNLTFYALVGREETQWALLRPLFHQAARNVLLIDVSGSLAQPILTPRPFPELNQTLQQWLAESLNEAIPVAPLGSGNSGEQGAMR